MVIRVKQLRIAINGDNAAAIEEAALITKRLTESGHLTWLVCEDLRGSFEKRAISVAQAEINSSRKSIRKFLSVLVDEFNEEDTTKR